MTTAAMALPASPTLTNPDMILPYGEYDTTSSPPQDPLRPESPVGGWKGLIPDDMSFSIGPPGHVKLGLGPVTPTTPIIYGNGTMLSDIGEVTEAESTPGRKSNRTQPRGLRSQDSPVRSSPTMGYDQNPPSKRKSVIHHRSVSMESDSTIRSDEPPADLFKDFDDGVSVDDSNFQGDDEESLMDESIDDDAEIAEAELVVRKESKLIESDDMHSSAALSRRAEMILANAKKRLDNMEGNLTRARSSLYITPSSSMSSIHSSSPLSRATPSPPGAERRIVAGLGVPPAKHRQTNQLASSANATSHSRVLSENSIPLSLQSPLRTARSPATSLPTPIPTGGDEKISKTSRHGTPTRSPSYYVGALEPLGEDEMTPPRHEDHEMVRASTADPYSAPTTDHRILTRSTSSMQMRDLTDKMKDLKGKISTLRDRAREENMKRRSLQSLRTPSPFTAAEQWYTSSASYKGGRKGANAGVAHDSWNGKPSDSEIIDGESDELGEDAMREESNDDEPEDPNVYEDVEEHDVNGEIEQAPLDYDIPSTHSEQDDVYETADEEEDNIAYVEEEIEGDQYDDEFVNHDELDELEEVGEYQSESEASLYHDALVQPISHEDREDAFDYEHFFLHSAMGTINRERLARHGSRDSMGSYGSEDSVETAKGPEAPVLVVDGDNKPINTPRGHVRNQKSTSTMASFVTANEGRRSTDIQAENTHDYAVQPVSPQDRELGPTPVVEKRSTFGKTTPTEGAETQPSLSSPDLRPSSTILSTTSEPTSSNRPSFASFASISSVGTSRSFPLVNKPKNANRASSILSEVLSLSGQESSTVDMLARDDQILIERLVSSLGKCVLGLHDAGRASSDGRMWRRRMDAARRVLEGDEGAI